MGLSLLIGAHALKGWGSLMGALTRLFLLDCYVLLSPNNVVFSTIKLIITVEQADTTLSNSSVIINYEGIHLSRMILSNE